MWLMERMKTFVGGRARVPVAVLSDPMTVPAFPDGA
jgi:hypothetical protein